MTHPDRTPGIDPEIAPDHDPLLLLASASPGRRATLRAARIEHFHFRGLQVIPDLCWISGLVKRSPEIKDALQVSLRRI